MGHCLHSYAPGTSALSEARRQPPLLCGSSHAVGAQIQLLVLPGAHPLAAVMSHLICLQQWREVAQETRSEMKTKPWGIRAGYHQHLPKQEFSMDISQSNLRNYHKTVISVVLGSWLDREVMTQKSMTKFPTVSVT